ncbi:MAG: hypothetical protein R3C19_00835 [Planctomycetaceae bacterium]
MNDLNGGIRFGLAVQKFADLLFDHILLFFQHFDNAVDRPAAGLVPCLPATVSLIDQMQQLLAATHQRFVSLLSFCFGKRGHEIDGFAECPQQPCINRIGLLQQAESLAELSHLGDWQRDDAGVLQCPDRVRS